MSQAALALDTERDKGTAAADVADRAGFELGWDHAHHGLVPQAGLLLDGTPMGQGWRAGKAVFGHRTLKPTQPVRQWLALRTLAWRRGVAFDGTQVTPQHLAQIAVTHCPVTRQPLGGAPGCDSAPALERLHDGAGYAAGNLAMVSRRAADAKAGVAGTRDALRRAGRIDAGIDASGDILNPAQHWRLAVLMSFATPLPFAEAARVPLRVLPPNRVRPLNAVQGLQALVTLLFSTPGWSTRVRALADLLPVVRASSGLRHDFNLFAGAVAPRLLEAGARNDPHATRRALEDAWADARVNRRWQQFVLGLGESATVALLDRAAAAGLDGMRRAPHAPTQAAGGWSHAPCGRVPVRRGRTPPPLAPTLASPATAGGAMQA